LNFALNPRPDLGDTPVKIDYEIKIESKTRVNAAKKMIFIVTSVQFIDKGKQDAMASIDVAISFEIENFSEVATELKSKRYDIERNLSRKLTSVSMDTVRGITFAYFRGSYIDTIFYSDD
jgi:hypothetical protein